MESEEVFVRGLDRLSENILLTSKVYQITDKALNCDKPGTFSYTGDGELELKVLAFIPKGLKSSEGGKYENLKEKDTPGLKEIQLKKEDEQINEAKLRDVIAELKPCFDINFIESQVENSTIDLYSAEDADLRPLFALDQNFTIALYKGPVGFSTPDIKSTVRLNPPRSMIIHSLTSKIRKINEVIPTCEPRIVIKLESPQPNIRNFITSQFTSFINKSKFVYTDSILTSLIRDSGAIKAATEYPEALRAVKTFSIVRENFKLNAKITLSATQRSEVQVCELHFQGEVESFVGSEKIDLKLVSEIYSQLKTVHKNCIISKDFRVITFKSIVFKLPCDSADVFADTEKFFDMNVVETEVIVRMIKRVGSGKAYLKEVSIIKIIRECPEEVRKVFYGIDDKRYLIGMLMKDPCDDLMPIKTSSEARFYSRLLSLARVLLNYGLEIVLNDSLIKGLKLYYDLVEVNQQAGRKVLLRYTQSAPLYLFLKINKNSDPTTYFESLFNSFPQNSSDPSIIVLSEIQKKIFVNKNYDEIELKKRYAKARLCLSQSNPYDFCVTYYCVHKKEGKTFLVTDKLSPSLQDLATSMDDQNIFRVFLKVLNILNKISAKQATVPGFDPTCILIDSGLQVKYLIKSKEEIREYFLAPEVKIGRATNKSLSYSFGKLVDSYYESRFQPVLLTEVNNFRRNVPEVIQSLIDNSTKISLFQRLDLNSLEQSFKFLLMNKFTL